MTPLEHNAWQIVIPVDRHDGLLESLESIHGYDFEEGPELQIDGIPHRTYFFMRRGEAEELAEVFGGKASPAPADFKWRQLDD
jgi:hypothetical protein